MENGYVVLKCGDCSRAFGVSARTRNRRCVHCGSSAAHREAGFTSDAEAAQRMVAAANTPPEISDELEALLKPANARDALSKGKYDTLAILQKAATEDDIVTLEALEALMARLNLPGNAEALIENANFEGALLMVSPTAWRLLL